MTARAAISALGTRISFLVPIWLLLIGDATLAQVAVVSSGQVLAYVVFRQIAQRLRPLALPADLLSVLVLGAAAFYLNDFVVFASLAGALSALRAISDRAPSQSISPTVEEAPAREGLTRALLVIAGGIVGAAAMWLGPVGALWANAMVIAVAAGLHVLAGPLTPQAQESAKSDALEQLGADPLVRRLATTLFATNLFAQAGAVVVVVVWIREITRTPELLGPIATAFIAGLVAGGLVFAGLVRAPARAAMLSAGCLVGAAIAYLVLLQRPPALLLVLVAALIAGVATASVVPATGTLLSTHVPPGLRTRVDGLLSGVSYLGIPLGTAAAAWFLGRATILTGLGAAAAAYLIAMLIPVFALHTWRQLLPDAPAGFTGPARLPARLTVTLAYANGQWLVEVRRGRALLGSRHLVRSAEALNMLALLDVPSVQDSVERALAADQTEAARQAERMRTELSELEARLAGLTEMVEITETHRPGPPGPPPKQREGEPASQDA